MPYLLSIITSLGGVIQRVPRLEKLAEAAKYARRPQAIVNCTGLGARSLTDVADLTVEPVRGQVVCLKAPWVKSGWTRQVGSLSGGEGGQRTYVIPRASGEVIIGGTRELNDW
jgi:glycine/D-amino acid oxidase-like deaminating enzyme